MQQTEILAPFAPGGEREIDVQIAQRLLTAALEAGGDYADLFFEYRVSADYVLEDERIKSVGRGVTMGLGVRVTKGDATGYAYSEDLSFERMANAARTAGQIAKAKWADRDPAEMLYLMAESGKNPTDLAVLSLP